MKISRLQQLVFASVLVAVPSMAAMPSVGASAPISLCGDAKGEKADNDSKDSSKSDDKADKKADKKDSKDKKASKGSV